MTIKLKKQNGFTTLELMFYILGMTMVLSTIFYLIISLYSLHKKISVEAKANNEASVIMTRLVDDIRISDSIDLIKSNLKNNESDITMIQIIDEHTVEKKYGLNDNRIYYRENTGPLIFLTLENVLISKLYLEHFEGPVSEAVKIDLEIKYETAPESFKTKTYSNFIILRNSYDNYE